ncbi:DUF382-domain-containing protein [Coccomyxa subellipsoidea C-169]|uniref:DUF382-domain-containing protein n=1 Tax=Coccomyxa subellipsoidea (strain C-169) TaxID=574566 RepID=I0YLC5_COCSC|nr:DUF382-domain-containing protein [Coccomyxa subellipsoidea C-169]EIE19194.1 DUF382-domain-containing protein [Coccomyxa subellipsoidea C-169]|eukprot:XP_005643738.1 DUF382-domain-containing protein [Coccomyxa subellipsoidea C-169]
MERNTLKNSTALQAVAGFAAGAAILGLAAWWYQSGKVPSKAPKKVEMAPIPDKDPDYASTVASRHLEAADAASPAGSQQADRQSDEHASAVHIATEGTLGDIEEIAPSAGAILDEEIILANAIADAPTISWRQTAEEVVLETPVGDNVRAKDLVCNINARSLYLAVQGKVLVDEPLFAPISPDESSWEIGDAEDGRSITVSLHKANSETSGVEVEYVSAPREYEELLQAKEEPEADDGGFARAGGLGFVSAGTSGAGLGSEGLTPGLGSGGATPSLGSDYGSETPYGGVGLGATPGLGSDEAEENGTTEDSMSPYEEFARVFSKFASAEEVTGPRVDPDAEAEADEDKEEEAAEEKKEPEKGEGSDNEEDEGKVGKESKRKHKMESRLKIAELKQTCPRPEVVEVWDVTAQDPRLLVYLKAYRNTVPVPRHWSQKRKYLQGKRGLEKPPFQLPEFIEATGIGEMRQAYQEKEESKKLRQKQKDKMQPKMGKLDIDYQVLHDAFFKHQTKPSFSVMGDLYYEGKEFEAKILGAKPGVLSEELRRALGMGESSPPPWLINMQRYGPPPSYPDLKIPGLNAPIPPGAQFGYQPGGWGKPPVDEEGNPLYGDVFGLFEQDAEDELVDKLTRWGDLESEEEESEEEEEEEEDEVDDTESLADGIASIASGYNSSLPSGIETPEVIDLRKGKAGEKPLYQVLEQQAAPVGNALMGSDHTYVIPGAGAPAAGAPTKGAAAAAAKRSGIAPGDVEVAIDPAELEGLDEAGVRALYEERLSQQRTASSREDFSDLVAAKAAQQKRKAAEKKEGKAKKQKEQFKF